jgi:hypothetical protein
MAVGISGGTRYFLPFRPNVQIVYYNAEKFAPSRYWAAYERLVDEAVQRILWRHEAPEQVLPPLAARLAALREHP